MAALLTQLACSRPRRAQRRHDALSFCFRVFFTLFWLIAVIAWGDAVRKDAGGSGVNAKHAVGVVFAATEL